MRLLRLRSAGIVSYCCCLLFLMTTGCSGGGGGGTSGDSTSASPITIQGQVIGPFRQGATVTVTQIGGSGRATANISDDLGNYTLRVPWNGLTRLEARGYYTDVFTGGISPSEVTLLAVVNATGGVPITANLNLVTTIAAAMVDETLKTTPVENLDLQTIDQRVADAVRGLLKTNVTIPNATSTNLFSGDVQSSALLTFVLASLLAMPPHTDSLVLGQEFAKNLLAGRLLTDAGPNQPDLVSAAMLETSLASMKYGTSLVANNTGQAIPMEQLIFNLADRYPDWAPQFSGSLLQALTNVTLPPLFARPLGIYFSNCTIANAGPAGVICEYPPYPPAYAPGPIQYIARGRTKVFDLRAYNTTYRAEDPSIEQTVILSVEGCPKEAICTLSTDSITLTSGIWPITLTMTTTEATPLDTYTLYIHANNVTPVENLRIGNQEYMGVRGSGRAARYTFMLIDCATSPESINLLAGCDSDAPPSSAPTLNYTGQGSIYGLTGQLSLANWTTNDFILEADGSMTSLYQYSYFLGQDLLGPVPVQLRVKYQRPIGAASTFSVQVTCGTAPITTVPVSVIGSNVSASGAVRCTSDQAYEGSFSITGSWP